MTCEQRWDKKMPEKSVNGLFTAFAQVIHIKSLKLSSSGVDNFKQD